MSNFRGRAAVLALLLPASLGGCGSQGRAQPARVEIQWPDASIPRTAVSAPGERRAALHVDAGAGAAAAAESVAIDASLLKVEIGR